MEDASQLQNLTLNPSEAAFSFPPYRRRPLRSGTYRVLIGILSQCRTNFPQLQMQVDSGDLELRQVSEENGSITPSEANSTDVLVPLPNSKESEDTLAQETSTGEKKENINSQDGGFDGKQETVPNLDHINLVTDGEQEVAPANSISFEDLLVVENQTGDCAVQFAKEQENVNSVLDIRMDDFVTLEELEVDKEFSICDFSEVLDSCFGMDMVIESSKAGEDSQENGTVLGENIPKEAEHELLLKEMELEKLINSSGAVESSCRLNADEEIEEGEISGDALYEDAVSLGERTKETVYASEDSFDKEEFICNDEDRGRRQHEMSDPSLVDIVNSNSSSMKVESRITAGQMQDCHSQNVFRDSHMETQRSGPIATCLEDLTPSSIILRENADDNQISATTEKDGNASKKKRKNGPLTKERRAKKKKKERLKRAEKNRKLGIKRLKLQPVLKPKTILYCRHYLHGRCHEGEKCNFSHDTVPLTKSKPCGHFARHSCLKGDDCPFDHQLSKYPCKNYTSNGFCSRGSDCLFSHEMPAKQSFSMTPNVSKPELTSAQHSVPEKGGSFMISKVTKPEMKFPSPVNNSDSGKHTDNRGIFHQKIDAKFCFAGNSPSKSAELLAAKPVPRTAGQAPRGVSFLSNGGMSLGDTSKNKQDGSSMKTTDVDVGSKTILKVPGSISKLNEMSERVAPRKPRGINFLSFAQPSSDDSSSKMFSNFLSNSNNETGKSVIDDMGESKVTCSLPESGEILKVNRQMNQSATIIVRDLNEKVNRTLLTVPQHINFLSFDKTHLDDSILKERANLHFNKDDIALSFVKERQSTPSKLQDTIKMPSLSFAGPSDQSTGGQNANLSGFFKTSFLSNTPSSVQKAVQSTLAFAANFEPDIKVGSSLGQQGS
ncbi:hypothetical protein Pfo_000284 [Paulownia fortunei]|nr:hypothetical protein Pfo_000284 [Paulownia fortunei]